MESLFECKNVNHSYEKFNLENISFSLPEGNVLGVIGKNGCGKTTLLRKLMGLLETNDTEEIRILDSSLLNESKEYHKKMAFVLAETPFRSKFSAVTNGKMFGKYYP